MSPAAAFDTHVADYDAQCMQGLGFFGETRAYVARGRLDFLNRWWRQARRAQPRHVIDYGSGLGDVTTLLASRFPEAEVTGVDPSQRSVAHARAHSSAPQVAFADMQAALPPADLVHVNGVLHHVAPDERAALFADVARRLAPGGVAAVFENNPLNVGTRLAMRRIPFDRDAMPVGHRAVRRGLVASGLRPARTGFLFYFPRWLAALRPLEPWLEGLPLGAQYGVIALRDGDAT